MLLINTQLVGETNRLAESGIGANCPNIVHAVGVVRDDLSLPTAIIIGINLVAFWGLKGVGKRSTTPPFQRRWTALYRTGQWVYRLSVLFCLVTATAVTVFNLYNTEAVYYATTGIEYMSLPVISLISSLFKLLFRPSFYRAAGSAASMMIVHKDKPLVSAAFAHKEFVIGSSDHEVVTWAREVAQARASPRHVSLVGCDVTDTAVITMCVHCPRLTKIKLTGTSKACVISDTAVVQMSHYCPNIESADFSSCSNITDIAITALARRCLGLTELVLKHCSNITDAGALELASQCRQLKTIDLSSCSQLTDVGVCALTKLPVVDTIYLSHCSKVTIGVELGQYARVWRRGGLAPSWQHNGEMFGVPGKLVLRERQCSEAPEFGAHSEAPVGVEENGTDDPAHHLVHMIHPGRARGALGGF